MPKSSPLLRAFNGGVVSELLDGRTDLDKYGLLMRQLYNEIPSSQGPALRRSGTEFQRPSYDETKRTHLLEFAFSNNIGQVYAIEAADFRFRWHNEEGILAQEPVAITATADAGGFLRVTAAGHGAAIGDQIVLAGFLFATGLNGRVPNVTAVSGNNVTTDIPYAAPGSIASATLALVYSIETPYAAVDVPNIRFTGDRDALYLWCPGYAVRKLLRNSAYDWRLSELDWIDGPYDNINETSTTIAAERTGDVVRQLNSDSEFGYTASSSGAAGGHEAYKAFDGERETYWQSSSNQTGNVRIRLPNPVIVDGYSIEMATENADNSFGALDYAPGTFTLDGSNDGLTWTTLDSKVSYVAYTNQRSLWFKLKNKTSYDHYRLNITQCTRNGAVPPRVGGLHLTARTSATVTLNASSQTGINNDRGFLATDIGRLLRLQSSDGLWRWLKIVERVGATEIRAEVKGDTLLDKTPTTEWRLGLFSDTTGHPISGTFFEDRLCMGGMTGYPDHFVCSVQGKYETILQTDPDGTVNDDNGIVLRLNSRKLGRIAWINSDGRSLLVGTESGEWQVSSADLQSALTARTAKGRRVNSRGSALVEPVFVDRQGLYVQRGARTLREIAYRFDIDGYGTPSMSLLASHLGIDGFAQVVFAQEPYSIAWIRTETGKLVGFTYNRDENVTGWHLHDVGGFVESMAVLPASTGRQDVLWLVVRRTVNGQTRRYIELMAKQWDFDSTLLTCFMVDAGVRYTGTPINKVYGFNHLIGERVAGLADGSPFTPQIIAADGSLTLPNGTEAANIVAGLPYDSIGETMRLEAGAGDGTAQGKTKRVTGAVLRLWQSAGGRYGVRNSEDAFDPAHLEDINWLSSETKYDEADPLFSGDTPLLRFPDGYNQSGSIIFMQPGELPLPFNVTAIAPQLNTQDR